MPEYAIEEAGDPERLAELIRLRLRDGWQLQGGVSVACFVDEDRDGYKNRCWWYAQALTREQHAVQP